MPTPVIVGAARTAIGRSFKGALVNTPPETLITCPVMKPASALARKATMPSRMRFTMKRCSL